MKPTLIAALVVGMASSASAGELFSGSHTYTGTAQTWMPAPGMGYAVLKMVGTFTPTSGPIPKSKVECRGANFWSSKRSEAEGVCVFGVRPNQWMLRYRMTAPGLRDKSAERFSRRGKWTVIGGVGRFKGMTGNGTYLAKSGVAGKGGVYKTMWAGEVTIPK
jgi:hypothetical protein